MSDAQDKNIDELKALAKTNPEVKELGVDMEPYAKLYRDHEDYTSGTGKKKRTYKYWAKELGISEKAAKALYEVF